MSSNTENLEQNSIPPIANLAQDSGFLTREESTQDQICPQTTENKNNNIDFQNHNYSYDIDNVSEKLSEADIDILHHQGDSITENSNAFLMDMDQQFVYEGNSSSIDVEAGTFYEGHTQGSQSQVAGQSLANSSQQQILNHHQQQQQQINVEQHQPILNQILEDSQVEADTFLTESHEIQNHEQMEQIDQMTEQMTEQMTAEQAAMWQQTQNAIHLQVQNGQDGHFHIVNQSNLMPHEAYSPTLNSFNPYMTNQPNQSQLSQMQDLQNHIKQDPHCYSQNLYQQFPVHQQQDQLHHHHTQNHHNQNHQTTNPLNTKRGRPTKHNSRAFKTDEEKDNERKERNRKAAQKCRQKKIETIELLEEDKRRNEDILERKRIECARFFEFKLFLEGMVGNIVGNQPEFFNQMINEIPVWRLTSDEFFLGQRINISTSMQKRHPIKTGQLPENGIKGIIDEEEKKSNFYREILNDLIPQFNKIMELKTATVENYVPSSFFNKIFEYLTHTVLPKAFEIEREKSLGVFHSPVMVTGGCVGQSKNSGAKRQLSNKGAKPKKIKKEN